MLPPLIEKLGSGAYGTVYKSFYQGQKVAVKQFCYPQSPSDKEAIDKEVELLRSLTSTHIIQFYDTYYQTTYRGEILCLIMELAARGSLQKVIEKGTLVNDWAIKKRIAQEIANGLKYIHDKGVLHRDLKSANVVLNGYLQAKLCDFGLAVVKASTSTHISDRMMGTTRWLAPEVFESQPKYSTKSDVFSFGVVMWELAADCTRPFKQHDNEAAVATVVMRGDREKLPRDTPPDFREWVLRCWAQDPSKRPKAEDIVLVVDSDDEGGSVLSLEYDSESESERHIDASTGTGISVNVHMASIHLSDTSSAPETGTDSIQTRHWSFVKEGQPKETMSTSDLDALVQRADSNNIEAQVELAIRYEKGDGVDADASEAFFWYLRAARKGHVFAQRQLGAYFQERDTTRCHADAFAWYSKAASQGDAEAQFRLGRMYELGNGTQRDDDEAMAWYDKAIQQGHSEARMCFAALCAAGERISSVDSGDPQNHESDLDIVKLADVLITEDEDSILDEVMERGDMQAATDAFQGHDNKFNLASISIDESKVYKGAKIGVFPLGDIFEGTVDVSENEKRRVYVRQTHTHLDWHEEKAVKQGRLIASFLKEGENISQLLFVAGPHMTLFEATTYPSLHSMFNDGVTLDTLQKLTIARKVAAAVMYLHTCGIIHRDIRGANVMIDRVAWSGQLEPKLGGFESSRDSALLSLLAPIGSIVWDAPERLRYGASANTDVYAFGVLMWEISKEQEPETKDDIVVSYDVDGPVDLENIHVSPPYTEIMQKCLDVDPFERPMMADVTYGLTHASLSI